MREQPGTADRAPPGDARTLSLEMTLRNVPLLDEIVFFVRDWVERLELELPTPGRCTVNVGAFRQEDERPRYHVAVRIVGPSAYAAGDARGTDLFHTVDEAFASTRMQLRPDPIRPDASGVVHRTVLEATQGGAEPGSARAAALGRRTG